MTVPRYDLGQPPYPGETVPAFDYHCHCEPVRTLVWQSVTPAARSAARPPPGDGEMRIATGFALAMTAVIWLLVLLFSLRGHPGGGGAARPTMFFLHVRFFC